MQKDKSVKIEDEIMNQIKSKGLKIRPKYYFVLGSIFITLSTIFSIALSIFSLNLIIFSERRGGLMKSTCIEDAISNYPWWAIILVVIGFFSAWWFYKKSGKGYKHDTKSIIAVILGTIILGGAIISFTNLDSILEQRGPLRHMYRYYDRQNNNLQRIGNCKDKIGTHKQNLLIK